MIAEQGEELEQAAKVASRLRSMALEHTVSVGIARDAVDNYWQSKDKQYQEYRQKTSIS